MLVSLSDIGRFLDRYRDDPVGFVRGPVNANPTTYQESWLRLYARHPRVAIRACRGAGKTTEACWAVLHFFITRPLSNCVVTAPTYDKNIRKMIWPEFETWIRRSPLLSDLIEVEVDNLRVKHPDYRRLWYVTGTTGDDPSNMEGFHAPHLLYLVDEAKSVPRATFSAITGSLTDASGDQRMVLISTPPEQPRGYFYDVFGKWRDRWAVASIDAFTAQRQGGRISDAWIAEKRDELGEGTPAWQAQVMGEFPDQGTGTLIPLSWIENAVRRHPSKRPDLSVRLEAGKPVEAGVDAAGSGADKTVMSIRQGAVQWEQHVIDADKAPGQASAIRRILAEWAARSDGHEDGIIAPVGRIKVEHDAYGGELGAELRSAFKHQEDDLSVRWYRPGARAHSRERFRNRRAEAWWQLRCRFRDGEIAILDDPELVADLSAIKTETTSGGKLKIEAKEKMKEELGRSPDKGDALMIAFAGLFRGTGQAAQVPI